MLSTCVAAVRQRHRWLAGWAMDPVLAYWKTLYGEVIVKVLGILGDTNNDLVTEGGVHKLAFDGTRWACESKRLDGHVWP